MPLPYMRIFKDNNSLVPHGVFLIQKVRNDIVIVLYRLVWEEALIHLELRKSVLSIDF